MNCHHHTPRSAPGVSRGAGWLLCAVLAAVSACVGDAVGIGDAFGEQPGGPGEIPPPETEVPPVDDPPIEPQLPPGCAPPVGVDVVEAELGANADGHHEAGQPCLEACHRPGGAGPPFLVGGTIYNSADGRPIMGATVNLIGDGGETFQLVSGQNGNFWAPLGAFNARLPATTNASDCAPMVLELSTPEMLDCNRGGCHDNTRRMFVRSL